MKAKLITKKGRGLKTQIEVKGLTLSVINELQADDVENGSVIDVEIYDAVYFEELTDNSIATNPEKNKSLYIWTTVVIKPMVKSPA